MSVLFECTNIVLGDTYVPFFSKNYFHDPERAAVIPTVTSLYLSKAVTGENIQCSVAQIRVLSVPV